MIWDSIYKTVYTIFSSDGWINENFVNGSLVIQVNSSGKLNYTNKIIRM